MTSELRIIHQSTGVIREALESIPQWRESRAALELLKSAQTQRAHPDDAVARLTELVLEEVAAGREVTADLRDAAVAMEAHTAADVSLGRAIDAARAHLTQEMDTAVRSNWGVLFKALAGELAGVVNDARKLGDTTALVDAESAIASDRVADFQALRTIHERHRWIRSEQSKLMRRAGMSDGNRFPEAAIFKAPDEVWKQWAAWRVRGYLRDADSGTIRQLTPPWGESIAPAHAGSAEFLNWAIANDVEVWVPGPAELKAESTRLEALTQAEATTDHKTNRKAGSLR